MCILNNSFDIPKSFITCTRSKLVSEIELLKMSVLCFLEYVKMLHLLMLSERPLEMHHSLNSVKYFCKNNLSSRDEIYKYVYLYFYFRNH